MASIYSNNRGLTTWGMRDGKQVWRVTWSERPNMVADVTGPYDLCEAFIRLNSDAVMTRLPWVNREDWETV